jgi:hypothetical protein
MASIAAASRATGTTSTIPRCFFEMAAQFTGGAKLAFTIVISQKMPQSIRSSWAIDFEVPRSTASSRPFADLIDCRNRLA